MAEIFYISGPQRKYVKVKAHQRNNPYARRTVPAYKRRYPHIGEVITHTSQPNYDGWGPDSYWSCDDWKAFHMALEAHHGLQQANIIFKNAWDAQDSFESNYNWCKYNATWVNYFLGKGLDLRSVVSAIIVPVTALPGNVLDDAGNVISNTTDAAAAISKLIKPLAFVAVGGLIFYGYKNYIQKK